MIILYVFLFSMILWPLLNALAWNAIIGKIAKKEWKTALNQFFDFLRARSETRVFLAYLTTMGSLAGVLPPFLSFVLEISTQDTFIRLGGYIKDNTGYVSAFLGLLVSFIYGLRLYSNNLPNRKEWKMQMHSAQLVISNFQFDMTPEWFGYQYERSLKSLGTRYSEFINFPISSMPLALAITSRNKERILGIFEHDYLNVTEKIREIVSRERKSLNSEKLDKVIESFSKLQKLFENFEVEKISQIVLTVKELNNSCRNLRYDGSGNYANSYVVNELCDVVSELYQKANNQWISFLKKKTLLIAGPAGIGKSHFLGELLTQRHKAQLPTLLVTGKTFESSTEPLSQLCSHFDYVGRNNLFLKGLNDYGKKLNQRVLLIIDGINEGAGVDYWKIHLQDFIHQIESYDYLGIVLSVRVSSSRNWAYELVHDEDFSVYNYSGFKGNTQAACEYFFRSFELEFPTWPIIGEEYSNPLFLIKYCRSHQLSGLPLGQEDFWTTIRNYCSEINKTLAEQYHYNSALNLVFDSLVKVAEIMVNEDKRWSLEYKDVIGKLSDVAKYVDQPNHFLDYLIEEGLLQITSYDDKTFVDFGFERFGDFFISYYLVKENLYSDWILTKNAFDLHALSILVPKIQNKELFEVASENKKSECFSAFWESLPYRESLTAQAESYLSNLSVGDKQLAILTSFRCLTRSDYPLNGNTLYDLLNSMSLAERDVQWSVYISEEFGDYYESALALVEWGYSVSQSVLESLNEKKLQHCAEGLLWILSSTNQNLRDKATHAIVNLTVGRPILMKHLIVRFAQVTDPYIQERLWAAIYGAVLCSQSSDIAGSIAKVTYKTVFKVQHVIENILVRDFAKGIIEYAISIGCDIDISMETLHAPFNEVTIPQIPDGEEINRRYKLDFDTINDKAIYIAQEAILSSMATEHDTREHMYGDFGRYVFQSNIQAFPVVPKEMSWWAIAMIFEEFGYDASLFASFDARNHSFDRGTHRIERIGKKYQRIALNRILAILTDVFPDAKGENGWFNPWLVQRSIDPTIAPLGMQTDNRNDRYSVPVYEIDAIKDDFKWMKSTTKMPPIADYLQITDSIGEKWINLFSYNKQTFQPKSIDKPEYIRDLWVFVQSFVIDKKYLNKVTTAIYKYGLKGRSFHENGEIYHLYSREFFWSSNYQTNVEQTGYYSHVPFSISNRCWDKIITEPTYLQYQQDSDEDSSYEESFSMLLPNQCLYNGLGLMYAKENGAWVDKDGKLTCYDNFVYGHGHSALLVRQSAIMNYLKQNDKIIVWPILIERMIRTNHGMDSHRIQCGGYAYLTPDGKIKYKFRDYEPTSFSKWKNRQKVKIKKQTDKVKIILAKHHLLKLSLEEQLHYLSDFSDTEDLFAIDFQNDIIRNPGES